jgi:hypothetical protein
MSIIPDDPNALLVRGETADALTAAGYPVKSKTLATKATRGGGPPYRLFGQRALYRWGDALAWAQSKLTLPRANTSERDVEHAEERYQRLTGRGSLAVAAFADESRQEFKPPK